MLKVDDFRGQPKKRVLKYGYDDFKKWRWSQKEDKPKDKEIVRGWLDFLGNIL